MLFEIGHNLMFVFGAWLLYGLCVTANIISKTYHNTHHLNQTFSREKLFDGIRKMLCLGLSSALLSVVASGIPYIPVLGEFISEDHQQVVSVVLIYSMYAYLIVRYFVAAHNSNMDIAKNQNIVDDIHRGGDA